MTTNHSHRRWSAKRTKADELLDELSPLRGDNMDIYFLPADRSRELCPIFLQPENHLNVIVLDVDTMREVGETHVGPGALKALAALVDAYPNGLTSRELNTITGSLDARADLKNLCQHNTVLRQVIRPPACKRGRPKGESGRWRLVKPQAITTGTG